MLEINSKKYNPIELRLFIDNAYGFTKNLSSSYPNYDKWFNNMVVPGMYAGTFSMLIKYVKGDIAGISIVSFTNKKLCTLRVAPEYRKLGIGKKLMSASMELLNTDKPLCSLSLNNMHQFKRLFRYYGFSMQGQYSDLYKKGFIECSFNGLIR